MGEQGLTPGLPRAREGSTNMYLNPKERELSQLLAWGSGKRKSLEGLTPTWRSHSGTGMAKNGKWEIQHGSLR